jgi:hypothetical protein
LALWLSTKLSSEIQILLNTKASNTASVQIWLQIINEIDKNNWNRAKTIFLFEICKREKNGSCSNHGYQHFNTICTFGTEYFHFYRYISYLQSVYVEEKCSICNIDYSSHRSYEYLYLKRYEEKIILNIQVPVFCDQCVQLVDKKFNFVEGQPCWLICEIDTNLDLTYDILPNTVHLNNKIYRLLCCTFNVSENYFRGIFYLNKNYYLVDDLNVRNLFIISEPIKEKIVTCFFYLEN